jgi:hypothetical protein
LLRLSDVENDCSIINRANRTVLLIEDDSLHDAVCKRMRDAGRTVLRELPPDAFQPVVAVHHDPIPDKKKI